MNEIDEKNVSKSQEQIATLREIVGGLIDLDTGLPLKGVTKEQMLYAIQEINKVKAIYEERASARQAINDEVEAGSWEVAESLYTMQEVNKKRGNIYPKWFLKVFGA